jgi:alginate O-acetyltransferase complex protein AlgJ
MVSHLAKEKMDKKKKTFMLLSVIMLGVGPALFLSFHLSVFWEMERIYKLLVFSIIFLLCIALFYILGRLFRKYYGENGVKEKVIYLSLSILFGLFTAYRLFFIDPLMTPQGWINGIGVYIEYIGLIITNLFCIPLIMYILLNSVSRFIGIISIFIKSDSFLKVNQYTISVLFISLCLLPAILSPNFQVKDDEFWGSDTLLHLFSELRFRLGDKLYQDTIISEHNWMVYANDVSLDDYQNANPFSNNQLETIYKNVNNLNDYLSSKDIKLIIIIPPNKNTIYPEYIPEEIPVLTEESRMDQVKSYLNKNGGFNILDLESILLEKRQTMQVYYATDTHWNPYGAYFAYQAVMTEIQKDFPDITPHDLDDYSYVKMTDSDGDIRNTLAMIRIEEEFFNLVTPYDGNIQHKQISNTYNRYINTSSTGPRLLAFHDSFGWRLIPFLVEHFSYSAFHRMLSIDLITIDMEKPDVVILEWTERILYRLLLLPDL